MIRSDFRKKYHQDIKTLQAYQAAIDEAAIVSITDTKGIILYINDMFADVSRYSPEELLGQTHRIVNSGYHPRGYFRKMWQTISKGNPWRGEIKNRAKDGSYYWVDTVVIPVFDENENIFQYLSVRNLITAKKEAEENLLLHQKELQELNEQLRILNANQHKVREEEQRRIAREIHDELGQFITGLKMDVDWLRRKLFTDNDRQHVQERLTVMTTMLDSTVKIIRKVSSELHPSILDDLGLVTALRWQSNEFGKRFGIAVQFRTNIKELMIDPDISTGLFRIYQEALTNIARHAAAGNVYSTLDFEGGNLLMTIRDDGKGFESTDFRSGKTFGLVGMKERANTLHGKLSITSKPGQGTWIEIKIPLQHKNLK